MEHGQEIYSKYYFQLVLQNKNTLNEMLMWHSTVGITGLIPVCRVRIKQ